MVQANGDRPLRVPKSPLPGLSALDRWAQENYQKDADKLDDVARQGLATYILKLLEQDKTYRQTQIDMMVEWQSLLDLDKPQIPLGHKNKTEEQLEAENAEVYISPLPYVFQNKTTNMLAGAQWPIDVSAKSSQDVLAAQQVEDMLYWWDKEWATRWVYAGNSLPKRDMAHFATARGEICILTMPNLADEQFPWHFEVEDPFYVYPRFSRRGLIRVIRSYEIPVLEAREDYPEAWDMLKSYQDDDTVSIVAYYDALYHCILVEGYLKGAADASIVKAPMKHGVKDLLGQPVVPWIINRPLSGSVRAPKDKGKIGQGPNQVGLGLLFGMTDVYYARNKLASMYMTNVAKSANPPVIDYIRAGREPPPPLNLAPGGTNTRDIEERVQVLEPGPSPQNAQPILQMNQEDLQKSTLNDFFYGNAPSGVSGFLFNSAISAGNDFLRPYVQGVSFTLALMYRRVLEIYKSFEEEIGPLSVTMPQDTGLTERRVGVEIDPAIIDRVGFDIEVAYQELGPQDKVSLTAMAVQLVQTGIWPIWKARKELGERDPNSLWRWVWAEKAMLDPEVMLALGPEAMELSPDELFKRAWEIKRQAAEAQRQAQQPGLPTGVLPNEQQAGVGAGEAPPREDPVAAQQRAEGEALANLLAGMGGSPPRPRFGGR